MKERPYPLSDASIHLPGAYLSSTKVQAVSIDASWLHLASLYYDTLLFNVTMQGDRSPYQGIPHLSNALLEKSVSAIGYCTTSCAFRDSGRPHTSKFSGYPSP